MIATGYKHLTFIFVLLFACATTLRAQDNGDDYLQYKFYKEDNADDDLWLTAIDREEHRELMESHDYLYNALYNLSTIGFRRRGEGYDGRRYAIGELDIEYSTARMLGALGLAYSDHTEPSGTRRCYFDNRDARYYPGHYIRAEFSGCNYIGGISHRGRYTPARDGVVLNDGWSFAHTARARTGRDLYVDGVYGNMLDLAAVASYSDRRNWLNIAITLPLAERGLRSSSVDEAYTLTNNPRYNPSWGFQDGKMRNSRVATSVHPDIIASWQHRLTATTTMTLSATIGIECSAYTTLAWFNTLSPAPDNYRYLPSYYADDATSREVRKAWLAGDERYTQIDWQGLYHTNAIQHDGSARYAVERRCKNMIHGATSLTFDSRLGGVDVEYGLDMEYRTAHEYKVMDDLLGASHIVDIDYYLIDDATYANNLQNDLRNPNRTIMQGDRYGYDYRLSRLSATLYGSALYAWEDMSIGASLHIGMESTRRRGYYEKELFPGSGSYGLSRNLTTNPYSLDISWRYDLGSHLLSLSTTLRGESPEVKDMFLQTQYNNRATEDYPLSTIFATNLSYQYIPHHRLTLDATLFLSTTANESTVMHYYDDLAGVYSDAVISHIGRIHFGIEASARVVWSQHLSSTAMVTAAMYRYRCDSHVRLYADTDNDLIANTTAATKGLHTGAPELVAYGDIVFRHSGWMARLSANFAGQRYVTPSMVRRTERVLSYAPSPEERMTLHAESRIADIATLDATISKRLHFDNGVSLNLQLSVRNLLGSNFVREGYEENRVRRTTISGRTFISPFANRLTYAYPRTFYLSASLWF